MNATDPSAAVEVASPARRRRFTLFSGLTGGITVLVIALVVFPLVSLAWRLTGAFADGSWIKTFTASWFWPMVRDSLLAVGVSSVIAVLIGGLIAWVQERTNAGLGFFGDALPLIPLFLPPIAMAVGWTILASPTSGFLNGAMAAIGSDFQFNVYSYPGLIFVYVLNGLPYAYLPIAAAFRNLDPSLEEAGRIAGSGPLRVLRTISLPAIGPSAFAGFMLAMVINFSVYSIPAVIATRASIEIPAVRIIRAIRGAYPPDYGTATVLSTIVVIFIAVLWVWQGRLLRGGAFAQVGGKATQASRVKLGWSKWLLRLVLFLYLASSALLPFIGLAIVSFQKYWQPDILRSGWTFDHFVNIFTQQPLLLQSVQNAVSVAFVVGAIVAIVAIMLAYLSRRHPSGLMKLSDGIAKLPAAIPHAVIAVAFIFAFAGPPFMLAGTLLILGIAFFMSYVPLATVTVEGSVAQIDGSLEESSAVSGATEARTFWRIVVPLALPGFFAAWAMVYVRVVSDLAISALLSGIRNPMLGAILLDLYDQGTYSQVAALTIVVMAVTIPVVFVLLRLGRPRWRRINRIRGRRLVNR